MQPKGSGTAADGRFRRITEIRTVAGGAVWNIAGRAGPLVVAFLVTPMLIGALGAERWGVFSLGLTVANMFMALDLGLGRCVTRRLAGAIGQGREHEAADAVWSGLLTLAGIGAVASIAGMFFVHDLVQHALNIPTADVEEATSALRVMLVAGPLLMLGGTLWGVLAAFQMFRAANLINVPIAVAYYVAPLTVLHLHNDLVLAMWTLVACRILMVAAAAAVCARAMPSLLRCPSFRLDELRPMLALGGWMTAANLLAPVLLYVDRFVIGALVSVGATGYYATPFDLVIRMTLVPGAICGTLFPAISAAVTVSPEITLGLLRRATLATSFVLLPPCAFLSAFAPEFMDAWVGPAFAAHSARVLAILSAGVLFECMRPIPATLTDGLGRSRLSAQFSALQLVAYLPVLWVAVRWLGVEGAALAWTARAMTDCAGHFLIASRLLPPLAGPARRYYGLLLLGAAMMATSWMIPGVPLRALWWLATLATVGTVAWKLALSEPDRASLLAVSRRLGLRGASGWG